VVPDDIEPVPEVWHRVGTLMLSAIFMVLAVICIVLFFTGFYVWSLLISVQQSHFQKWFSQRRQTLKMQV
jgi:hypothetical protein